MQYLKQAEASDADRTDNETQELVKAIFADVRERGDEASTTSSGVWPALMMPMPPAKSM